MQKKKHLTDEDICRFRTVQLMKTVMHNLFLKFQPRKLDDLEIQFVYFTKINVQMKDRFSRHKIERFTEKRKKWKILILQWTTEAETLQYIIKTSFKFVVGHCIDPLYLLMTDFWSFICGCCFIGWEKTTSDSINTRRFCFDSHWLTFKTFSRFLKFEVWTEKIWRPDDSFLEYFLNCRK